MPCDSVFGRFYILMQNLVESSMDAAKIMEIRFAIEPCRQELLGPHVVRYSAAFMFYVVGSRRIAHGCPQLHGNSICYRTVLSRASGTPCGSVLGRFRALRQHLVESRMDAPKFMEIRFAIEPCRRELLGCRVARYSATFVS